MNGDLLFSVILAFIGNSMIAVGQSIQKAQVSRFDSKDERRLKVRGVFLWLTGIACSNGGLVAIYFAISKGYTTIIGAMNASALMVLLFIARFFLKEHIKPHEIWGILLIFIGVAMIPFCPSGYVPDYHFSLMWLWIGVGFAVTVYLIALIIFKIRKAPNGLILASFAGILTAVSQLFQKVANLPHIIGQLSPFLSVFHRWVFLPFLGASFLSLQFAYRKNKAITVIPVFNAVVVIIPVWVGFLFFGERLSAFQWSGVGLILAGIAVINYFAQTNGEDKTKTE